MVLALTVADRAYSHSWFCLFLICASLVRPPGLYGVSHTRRRIYRGVLQHSVAA